MRPVLTVEGKNYPAMIKVIGFYDDNSTFNTVHVLEDTDLKWELPKDESLSALEKRIYAHEERMSELATEFMELAIANNNIPFPEIEGKVLKEEYQMLMLQTEGLIEAKRIILNERSLIEQQIGEEVKQFIANPF
ncbi:hypothetical protein [Solibacillus cecembensis]|uniref:hypothetical protein n=1 Tax=Solibacillus cecembensis TaxID=459347 RepID=UPI003CFD4206